MHPRIIDYDASRFDFRALIESYAGTDALEDLKAQLTNDPASGNSLYKNMEQSPVFKSIYAGLDSPTGREFYQLYAQFVREVIRPRYDGPIYYQTRPSHRVLFADVPGESRFHRDADYGHDPAEVNYWVPQTPAYDTNTFWIESEAGKADYRPVELGTGQFVEFPGATLSHGAKNNTTGKSRVSFDFRVIPADRAPERYRDPATAGPGDESNPVRANALKFTYCE